MSVINRMLLELDERHDGTAQQQLPGMVRAVPTRLPGTSYRPWLLAAFILASILLLGFFIWRSTLPSKTTLPALVSAPSPVRPNPERPKPERLVTPPQPLQLKPAISLDHEPIPTDNTQPISVAPAPIPTPDTHPISPTTNKPTQTSKKFLLPAREEPRESSVNAASITKSSPGSEKAAVGMKQVSKEQQADFNYREALSLVAQNRTQEAQTALENALQLDPQNIAARQALLSIFLQAKRYPQAEQVLQEGLRLNFAMAPLATALASVQLERGDSAAALATLEKYAAQANNNADYHGMYAALLQRAGRHMEAINQFQAALKIQPKHANWLMGLGISLQAEKRYADAEQAYSRARASNGLAPDLQAFVEQRLQQVRQAH